MSERLRVLLVEDNPGDVNLIRETLSETGPVSFRLESVSRLSEALARLEGGEIDLVLLDLSLPDSQGLETFRKLREAAPDIPTVVLTGTDDQELAVAAVREGAQDYLVKGEVTGNLLARAVRYAVERKRAEVALRESETKLKEAQRLGRIGLWEFDIGTRQIHWSDMVFELYDRNPKLGPPSQEEEAAYYSPEDAERLCNCARIAVETGESYEVDVRVKLPGGRLADVVAIGTPVKDAHGRVIRLLGTVQDITKRKRATEALWRSEERYRALIRTAMDGFWVVDMEGRLLEVNDAYCTMVGYPREALLSMRISDLDCAEMPEQTRANMQQDIAQGWGRFESKHRRADGNVIDVEVSALYLAARRVCLCFIRDITGRRRAEEALQASEKRYKALFQSAAEGILVADVETKKFLYANPAVCRMLGYTEEEMLQLEVEDIHPKEDLTRVLSEFEAQARGEKSLASDLPCLRRDGTRMYVDVCSASLMMDGRHCNAGLFTDITERKRAEEGLKRLEWMLSKKPSSAMEGHRDLAEDQGYGNLTELNRNGIILQSIGKDLLWEIASEYLDVMETSSAIYEKNGDYAFGIFSSHWCRLMDRASRCLCNTEDNTAALNSGKWLCHESCWTCCSKEAIAQRAPVDIECNGGIRLYSVPILAGEEVIGAINFGYGDPPKDPARLRELADLYRVDYEDLVREANAYDSRPTYIVEMAKSRLRASAGLIGTLVERKRAEEEREKTLLWQQGVNLLQQSLLAPAPLESKLKSITDSIVRLFDADFCRIWVIRPGDLCKLDCAHAQVSTGPHVCRNRDKCLHLLASSGRYTHTDGKGHRRVPFGCYKIGRVASDEEPKFITNDVQNEPRVHNHEWARELGLVSFAGYRLSVPGGKTLGVLALFAKHPILSTEDAMLDGLSSAVALVIQQAVAEETLRKTEEQLLQSQKMEAVGRLAGGVAHDFNNLLTAVIGYSDLLLNRVGGDEELRKDVEEVKKAGERGAALTRQLLAFSRRQIFQLKLLNLNEIVSDMEQMARRLIGEDIDLLLKLQPDLHSVKFDSAQIEQMIMNIVVNARDAMPNGGKITIETANVELDEAYVREHAEAKLGPHVMLAITDTGLGMDAETRARIFEPFFTTKGVGKGTGLGLSTVYGIVKQSGGSIWVYSEPGRGTTFKIYVPRAEGAAEPLKRPVAAAEVSRGTETILLVEDDEGVRKLICDVLRSNGYTVMVSEDGEKAVEICKQHEGPIHLLLTDVVLPKMGGPEIAKRLLARRPSMKVLYMSGYADKAIVHNGVLEEGTAFLGKPVSPQALLSKVREVLEKSTG